MTQMWFKLPSWDVRPRAKKPDAPMSAGRISVRGERPPGGHLALPSLDLAL